MTPTRKSDYLACWDRRWSRRKHAIQCTVGSSVSAPSLDEIEREEPRRERDVDDILRGIEQIGRLDRARAIGRAKANRARLEREKEQGK